MISPSIEDFREFAQLSGPRSGTWVIRRYSRDVFLSFGNIDEFRARPAPSR
jgi:hypothetical protein